MSLNKRTKDMAAALHIRTYSPLKKPFPFHSMLRKLYDWNSVVKSHEINIKINNIIEMNTSFPNCKKSPSGPGPPEYRGFTITLSRTPLVGWSARSRDMCLTTHNSHTRQTDIQAPGGIRTRNPGRRATADPRLRPCSQWDRRYYIYIYRIYIYLFQICVYI